MIAAALSMAEPAQAAGGAYGILEGRTAALVHPAVMGTLFVGCALGRPSTTLTRIPGAWS